MIITVGHTKGEVGKSTIVAYLAVCCALDKKKVLLIDAAVQG
jgi:cellulose biosynthesis protein BcsQ